MRDTIASHRAVSALWPFRLQEDFAKEKERRLVERARMAPILSLGF